jgi:hypothetical protein
MSFQKDAIWRELQVSREELKRANNRVDDLETKSVHYDALVSKFVTSYERVSVLSVARVRRAVLSSLKTVLCDIA